MLKGAQNLQRLRRAVPARAVPAVVRWRVDRLWRNEAFRLGTEAQMRTMLAQTGRADEAPAIARAHAQHMLARAYLRWHPRTITRQRVHGAEWLTTRRDANRAVVLSFLHHGQYDGMFASLARYGVHCDALVMPDLMRADTPLALKQHVRVVRMGARVVPAVGGTDAIAARLGPGVVLAIASDIPGRTPVTFLGRRVLGSFGAARIAAMTDSPVVLITHRRDEEGPYLHVDPPLEPSAFDDARALLDEMLARHSAAVLAWPEAVEAPGARWGSVQGQEGSLAQYPGGYVLGSPPSSRDDGKDRA